MAIEDMVKRHSNFDETQDFIPTPPWATRVLYEEVAPELKALAPHTSVLDPAMGAGHMLKVFSEYGHPKVSGSDLYQHDTLEDLAAGTFIYREDFVKEPPLFDADLIITNPPYKHLNQFILRSLDIAKHGVAMLVRVQALESEGRYNSIFKHYPPTQIAFFANRIPFKTGEVKQKAPKMFFHVWLYWRIEGGNLMPPQPPKWIPFDAQTTYEKEEDYV